MILLFPAISVVLLSTILYTSIIEISIGPIALVISVAIFTANVAILLIITKLSADKQIKQDNALLNQQIKMGMENIAALNSAYAQQRKLTHDFNNHLSVIRSLLESGDTAQAKEYTGSLLASSISVTRLFDSGNTIVDTLLTQKYNHAKELGIKMQVLVEDLSQVAMSSENLVVVLSNLLDNAIEACMNTGGEKMIKVKFVLEDMGHILTVQNTAPNTPQAENRQFTTTKADRLNHGYGIKNISSVLDSYGYPHSYNYENGIFTFTAIMVG
ncbi:MAG: GHKL domain-containing protein [Oscillospiraceae bacterium]|nr:GHKL domain-containing protein [Oscillospiraceae bacterium]